MNRKQSRRFARISPRKFLINKGAKRLTAQAGLIPVVKFLHKHGILSIIKETINHQRGATALYDAADAVFLPLIAIIGGARSVRAIVTIWSDTILCRAAGWLKIPDETTLGRIFRTFTQRHINEMELLIHRFRGKIWRAALRAGKSKVSVAPCIVIDVDSTEKTIYGSQQGTAKGYNPHKRGAVSYHPLLAFCVEPGKFSRAGCAAGTPIPATVLLSSLSSSWPTFPTVPAFCFAGTADFLSEPCLTSQMREGTAI